MKKLFIFSVAAALLSLSAFAQEATTAQQDAVEIANTAPVVPEKPKPSEYWYLDFNGALNYGGTFHQNWAAGGDEFSHNLRAFVDANANYKKDAIFWNNRLQLDFGFLYASSKPILQKSDDRIYLESKFGYSVGENFFISANFDFKSQFAKGYDYKTPSAAIIANYPNQADGTQATDLEQLSKSDRVKAWEDARVLKSDILSPAYTNLALGVDWTPTNWFSMSVAPLTGGFVIVKDIELRKAYGMSAVDENDTAYQQALADYEANKTRDNLLVLGSYLKSSRFELGAQIKMDFKVTINDKFKYTSQIVAFTDYLMMNAKDGGYGRVAWDNRIDFNLTKYISLNFISNMLWDSKVRITKEGSDQEFCPVQWKEMLGIGLTYKIANK